MTDDRQHPTEEDQIAGPYRFDIGPEGCRRRGKRDAEFPQPSFRAGCLSFRMVYHLPRCAPPSTCSTSPVTRGASVRKTTASTISSTFEMPAIGDSVFR